MIGRVEMMQTAPRAVAAALLAAALEARGADAAPPPDFRLFPELAAPAGLPDLAGGAPGAGEKAPPRKKRFALAAAEVGIMELLPYLQDRLLTEESYAHISAESIRNNFRTGFVFDNDKFTTNQLGHAVAGSLFFNAPRSNGYSFWESAPFVLFGSAFWETIGETQAPSLNDLVNTTLGGITMGEASYRLSQMILDDRARGGARAVRETLAGLVNPTQLLTRLFTGDAWTVRPERGTFVEPSAFVAQLDGGWGHLVSNPRPNPDQAIFSASLRYGDPFDRAVSRPFDAFDLDVDVAWPSTKWLTNVAIRGLLVGWDLDAASAGARHVFGVFMDFDYTTDDTRMVGAQSFRFGLLGLRPLGKGVDLRVEALGSVAPLAAVQTDHPDESSGLVGRVYDYGPGAGVFTAARLRRRELDLVTFTYSLFWVHTSNGIGRNANLSSFGAEGRLPIAGGLSAGAAWSWWRRITTYDAFDTVRTATTQGRVFLSWMFR